MVPSLNRASTIILTRIFVVVAFSLTVTSCAATVDVASLVQAAIGQVQSVCDEKLQTTQTQLEAKITLLEEELKYKSRHLQQAGLKPRKWLTRKVKGLQKNVSSLGTDLAACAKSSDLGEVVTRVATLEDNVNSRNVDIKATKLSLEARVSEVESEFLALESDVSGRSSSVSDLEARVSAVESSTTRLDADLNSTKTALEVRLSEVEPNVAGLATLVSSTVSNISDINRTASALISYLV